MGAPLPMPGVPYAPPIRVESQNRLRERLSHPCRDNAAMRQTHVGAHNLFICRVSPRQPRAAIRHGGTSGGMGMGQKPLFSIAPTVVPIAGAEEVFPVRRIY